MGAGSPFRDAADGLSNRVLPESGPARQLPFKSVRRKRNKLRPVGRARKSAAESGPATTSLPDTESQKAVRARGLKPQRGSPSIAGGRATKELDHRNLPPLNKEPGGFPPSHRVDLPLPRIPRTAALHPALGNHYQTTSLWNGRKRRGSRVRGLARTPVPLPCPPDGTTPPGLGRLPRLSRGLRPLAIHG